MARLEQSLRFSHGAMDLVRNARRHLWEPAIGFLFPPLCPFSDARVDRHGTVSPQAWASLEQLAPPWCEGCGSPFAAAEDGPLCALCASPGSAPGRLVGARRLERLRCALRYDAGNAGAILAFKYGDRHDGVAAFGALMTRAGRELLGPGTVLVPVPLHRDRLRRRRYNQAGVLAEAVARLSGRPVDHGLLRRIRPTPSQKGASPVARTRQVSGAFAVRGRPPQGTRVVLVDDVVTTGATLLACTRALKRAGVAEVSGLALARAFR